MSDIERLKERCPDLPAEFVKAVETILSKELFIELEKPVIGYWDGGPKSSFTFTPRLRFYTDGPPNIEWGSWGANLWVRIEVGRNAPAHFAAVKRKLRGNPRRKFTVQDRA